MVLLEVDDEDRSRAKEMSIRKSAEVKVIETMQIELILFYSYISLRMVHNVPLALLARGFPACVCSVSKRLGKWFSFKGCDDKLNGILLKWTFLVI